MLGLIDHAFGAIRRRSAIQALLHTGWFDIQLLLLLLQLLLLLKVLLGDECICRETQRRPSFLTLPRALFPLLGFKISGASAGVIGCFGMHEWDWVHLLRANCA